MKKSLTEKLTAIVTQKFLEQYGLKGERTVSRSARPDLCQFQCNSSLAVAKKLKKKPKEIALAVSQCIVDADGVGEVSVAGPGFINISMTDKFLSEYLTQMSLDPSFFCGKSDSFDSIVIDFGGPNVAKPMHVGHLRSTIIGDCLQRVCRFLGYKVISDIHLGDWGLQMGMLINALEKERPELPYFDKKKKTNFPKEPPITLTHLEQMYPTASARCKQDEFAMENARTATVELQNGREGYKALWKHFVKVSTDGLHKDFQALGVNFDYWLGESDSQKEIPQLLYDLKKEGYLEESEGAQVIHLSPTDDSSIPPLIIVKSDGGVMYGTTDLATVKQRIREFSPDLILYVVDSRQELHFRQFFQAVKKTGIAGKALLEHIGFGTVNGTDGKPFKTREGGVMKLGDLIQLAKEAALKKMTECGLSEGYTAVESDRISYCSGLAAIKFADLSNYRMSNYIFDIEKFIQFEGKTGPYLLYAGVRIKSILRKAKNRGFESGSIKSLTDKDRSLALCLTRFPDVVQTTYEKRGPNYLCEYLFELAQEFSSFYQNCHIMKESNEERKKSWLSLAELTLKQLETGLYLLGIEVPERM